MKVAGVMVHAGLIETEQNTSVRGGFRALLRDIISSLNLPTPAGYLNYTRILLLCLLFLQFFRLRNGNNLENNSSPFYDIILNSYC